MDVDMWRTVVDAAVIEDGGVEVSSEEEAD